jgi:hypothetical protein
MISLVAALVLTLAPQSCDELDRRRAAIDEAISDTAISLEHWQGERDEAYDKWESLLLKLIAARDDIDTKQKQLGCQ